MDGASITPSVCSERAAIAAVVSLAVLVPVTVAHSQSDEPPPQHEVLLVATGDVDADEPLQELALAIEAHLSAFPIAVELLAEEIAVAESEATWALARERDALSVAWLSEDRSTFFILTPALDTQPRSRPVPDTGGGWASRCEVMGAMLASELEPLIAAGVLDTPPQPEEEEEVPEEEEVVEPALPRPPTRGVLYIGYLPTWLAGGDQYLNGVAVGGGLRPWTALEITVELDSIQPADLGLEDNDGRLVRVPLRLSAYGMFPMGWSRVDLGLVGALVAELWQVAWLGYDTRDEDATRIHFDPGLSLAVRLRLWPLPWLAPFMDAGVDFFYMPNRYRIGGETILQRDALQPRLVVGVAFRL